MFLCVCFHTESYIKAKRLLPSAIILRFFSFKSKTKHFALNGKNLKMGIRKLHFL